jgi:predicted transcriptional regulator
MMGNLSLSKRKMNIKGFFLISGLYFLFFFNFFNSTNILYNSSSLQSQQKYLQPLASSTEVTYYSNISTDEISTNFIQTTIHGNESRRYEFSKNNSIQIIHNNTIQVNYTADPLLENRDIQILLEHQKSISVDLQLLSSYYIHPLSNYKSYNSRKMLWSFNSIIKLTINEPDFSDGFITVPISNFQTDKFNSDSGDIDAIVFNEQSQSWNKISLLYDKNSVSINLSDLVSNENHQFDFSKGIYLTFVNYPVEVVPSAADSPSNYITIFVVISAVLVGVFGLLMSRQEFRAIFTRNANYNSGFHHLSIDAIFENENRKKLLDEILENPGVHFNELKRCCELQTGQINWHLRVMEQYGVIKKNRVGQYLCYYAAFEEIDAKSKISLKKSRVTLNILEIIEHNPEITSSEIALMLNMKRNSIKYHVDKLINLDLLKLKNEGRKKLLSIKND